MPEVGRDTPHVTWGSQTDYRRLYYSEPQSALKIPITVHKGHGILKMGQAMAENTTTGDDGRFMPYDPTAKTGSEYAPGRAHLLVDGAADTNVYVTPADSDKFTVGDNLNVIDANSVTRDLGAITAITREDTPGRAKIVVTNNVTTAYTTAQYAYVYINGAKTAVGILEKTIDTTNDHANATLIVSNATLYTGMLWCFDSDALADFSGAVQLGQFTILK